MESLKSRVLLWLDDLRNPFLNEESRLPEGGFDSIVWVRNAEEFKTWVKTKGLPYMVSFDHDLSPEHYVPEYFWDSYDDSEKYQLYLKGKMRSETGEDCAKWLVNLCLDKGLKLPLVYVHSANPVGCNWIKKELNNYFLDTEKEPIFATRTKKDKND